MGDLEFDLRVYTYGCLSVVSQALYLLLVQRSSSEYSTVEILHVTSINSLPLMILCCYVTGEYKKALLNFDTGSPGFVLIFVIVISIGCLLNYLLFLCTAMNSALTTSITGVLKSVLQTTIGLFTFGGINMNFFTVLGICTNMSGAVMYAVVKYREKFLSLPIVREGEEKKSLINKESSNVSVLLLSVVDTCNLRVDGIVREIFDMFTSQDLVNHVSSKTYLLSHSSVS